MRMFQRKRVFTGAALLLVMAGASLICAGCAREEAEPCMGICYRISGGKNDMVVLGSIHVGNESMRHYGEHIENAMDAADVFVFECDNDSAEAKAASSRLMRGELKNEISEELYAMVEQVAQKLRLSMGRWDGMRPWAVTSSLSTQIAAGELGVRDASAALSMGVEAKVRQNLKNKTLAYMETAEAQLEVLGGLSPALQEALLKDACDMVLNPKETSLKNWPDWWRDGDAEAFAKAYAEENQMMDASLAAEYHDALVTRRNKNMALVLSRLLEEETPHTYFVTVGLLHLVLPEDSILWELTQMGYTVERLGAA